MADDDDGSGAEESDDELDLDPRPVEVDRVDELILEETIREDARFGSLPTTLLLDDEVEAGFEVFVLVIELESPK